MIYTVTTNPSLDYYMELDRLPVLGGINRAQSEAVYPGGKGINVAVMAGRLGEKACALGFAAGTIGKAICTLLENEGCASEFIECDGESRINVKLLCEKETAVNGNGPAIDKDSAQKLLEKADTLTADDTLVLSGNLQKSCENLYESLALRAKNAGARLVVDATGDALRQTLKHQPWLIKPNQEELAEYFGECADTDTQIVTLAKKLQQEGAQNVLVSLGAEGALLVTATGRTLRARISAAGRVVSTVGAGDSMVAGFLAGTLRGCDEADALRLASAAGTASAYTRMLAERADVERVLEEITVE